jgi:hypothetical protein
LSAVTFHQREEAAGGTCPRTRYARYYGIGEWRLRADVVDSAQATVIRRILNPAKRIPEHLPAYARAVFRHLVKSGPTVALSRDVSLSLG